MKKALITGITGQDGAYLANLLLEKNYEVFGGVRRNSQDELHRLKVLKIHQEVTFINLLSFIICFFDFGAVILLPFIIY